MSLVNQRNDFKVQQALGQIQTQNDVAISTAISTGASIGVNTSTNLQIYNDLSSNIIPAIESIEQSVLNASASIGVNTSTNIDIYNDLSTRIIPAVESIQFSLEPKTWSTFGTVTPPPSAPFSGNFVSERCVWGKFVCEVTSTQPAGGGIGYGSIIFYDTSGTPTGTEDVLLRISYTPYSVLDAGVYVGQTLHDINFPNGGLVCENGIGFICDTVNGVVPQQVNATGYYLPYP